MTPKKKKVNKEDALKDRLKNEVALELGLMDEVKEKGWGGLTSRQTGRIGGHLSSRKSKKKSP